MLFSEIIFFMLGKILLFSLTYIVALPIYIIIFKIMDSIAKKKGFEPLKVKSLLKIVILTPLLSIVVSTILFVFIQESLVKLDYHSMVRITFTTIHLFSLIVFICHCLIMNEKIKKIIAQTQSTVLIILQLVFLWVPVMDVF